MSFTKRFSGRWQARANYAVSGFWDSRAIPYSLQPDWSRRRSCGVLLRFDVAPDIGDDYALANTDQRHRATFNGIWEMGYGFQLSGLYFFGSGQRFATNWGGDLRNLGTTAIRARGAPVVFVRTARSCRVTPLSAIPFTESTCGFRSGSGSPAA